MYGFVSTMCPRSRSVRRTLGGVSPSYVNACQSEAPLESPWRATSSSTSAVSPTVLSWESAFVG